MDQAAAIPYRWTDEGIEVLLVTARSDGSWIAPKGGIEFGEQPDEAAAREALEEAGVEGNILPGPLGDYYYDKASRQRHLIVYALHVSDAHPEWDESHQRTRCWAPLDLARQLVEVAELVDMFDRLAERLNIPVSPPRRS